ncbi:MAG TPA: histone deacetylase [Longimicrobiales bacterium]|nr:histone deacetylase [Longimicrobiales bacterium]
MHAPTGFYLHPSSALHDTGWNHPEHQGRLRALASTVGRDMLTLHGHVEQQEAPEATVDDLLRVHTRDHVKYVREICDSADVQQKVLPLSSDTMVSPESWGAAVGSVGASIAAAEAVADGRLASAFVATRPPGHHATPHHAMGFCLFNNVAITARHLQATGRAERVLIVDWDVHHGNGTQDTFYADPTVFYLSLHQSPHYPGTGDADQTGRDAGVGTTLNVPLPAGTSRDFYRARFRDALSRSLEVFTPDFVLVSAGFDALKGDPLGGQLLEPEDFHGMTLEVMGAAASVCRGRVVALLEGGYDPPRVGQAALHTVRGLAGL